MILLDEFKVEHEIENESEFGKKILNLNLEFDNGLGVFHVPFKFISDNMPWGWWNIISTLEKLKDRYDVDHLLRPPATNPSWNIHNIDTANNEQLGEMLSYFGSQLSFHNAELGLIEGELAAVQGSGGIALQIAVAKLEMEGTGRRPLKDTLEGMAIGDSSSLRATKRKEIELTAKAREISGYRDAWNILWQTTSREITRRQMEMEKRRT